MENEGNKLQSFLHSPHGRIAIISVIIGVITLAIYIRDRAAKAAPAVSAATGAGASSGYDSLLQQMQGDINTLKTEGTKHPTIELSGAFDNSLTEQTYNTFGRGHAGGTGLSLGVKGVSFGFGQQAAGQSGETYAYNGASNDKQAFDIKAQDFSQSQLDNILSWLSNATGTFQQRADAQHRASNDISNNATLNVGSQVYGVNEYGQLQAITGGRK